MPSNMSNSSLLGLYRRSVAGYGSRNGHKRTASRRARRVALPIGMRFQRVERALQRII